MGVQLAQRLWLHFSHCCWLHAHGVQPWFHCSHWECAEFIRWMFLFGKINYTYSTETKNLQWQKKDFISKDTLHVRPLFIYTGQEEVAQYRIQTWGEMVYIAITTEYSKWWIQRATSPLQHSGRDYRVELTASKLDFSQTRRRRGIWTQIGGVPHRQHMPKMRNLPFSGETLVCSDRWHPICKRWFHKTQAEVKWYPMFHSSVSREW